MLSRSGRSLDLRLLAGTAVLAFGLGLAAPALAAGAETGTTLYLRATVAAPVSQNILDISLRAQDTSPDPVAAQSAVNRRMGEALDLLRTAAKGKEQGALEYATGTYTMWQAAPPPRPASDARGREAAQPWTASEALTLKGTDMSDLLKIMGELQKKGLIAEGMRFEASAAGLRAAHDDATTRAVLRLREEAGKIASSLGMTVASIHDLRVEGSNPPPRPLFAAMSRSATAGFAPPVASPGEGEVNVTVSGTFLLNPAAH